MTEIETPRERAARWNTKKGEKEMFRELDEHLTNVYHSRLMMQCLVADPQFPKRKELAMEIFIVNRQAEHFAFAVYVLNRIRRGTPLIPDSVIYRSITDDDESSLDAFSFYLAGLEAFLEIPKPKATESQVEHLRQSLLKDEIDIHLAKYRSAQRSYRKHGEKASDRIIRAALDQLRVGNPPTN
ncbi:MAG: hypothetical protein ABGZ53_08225 [Fuerstiella sp.]